MTIGSLRIILTKGPVPKSDLKLWKALYIN